MKQQKYFNNKKPLNPIVKNRRDADKLIESSHKVAMLLTLTILHDKYGFGSKRLGDFAKHYHNLLDSYNKGNVSIDDFNATLYGETGIRVI